MISSTHQGWLRASNANDAAEPWILVLKVVATFAVIVICWTRLNADVAAFYLIRQDLPVLCLMTAAAVAFPYLRVRNGWSAEPRVTARQLLAGAVLLFAVCVAGHWLVMQAHDLSRDEAMATFQMQQIRRGSLLTPVPAEWQPFGHAMLPLYFDGRIDPGVAWTSGYLPGNSALQALVASIAHPALANPLLLVAGLCALWHAARVIWPQRRDVAIVVTMLGVSSTQLIVNSMTSYAMVGHFALNMLWLVLFLRGDRLGLAGALLVGFFAMGLHQFHFHPLFVAPFMLWLALRRQWGAVIAYGVAYLGMALFWFKIYPAWLGVQAGPAAIAVGPAFDLRDYIFARVNRLFQDPLQILEVNLARFVAWQNLLLLPLVITALPLLRSKPARLPGPFLPLVITCAIGLVLMINQGHGWGYRYLSGLLGCFCLLAGYGWVRLVPEPGRARAWIAVKGAFLFTLAVVLPLQLCMAHSFVAPNAKLLQEIRRAPADVVLIDPAGAAYAQDLVQNAPDFVHRPMVMDLSLVPLDAIASLCRARTVLRVDRRHFQAAGMHADLAAPDFGSDLDDRREILDRLGCAPPLRSAKG